MGKDKQITFCITLLNESAGKLIEDALAEVLGAHKEYNIQEPDVVPIKMMK